MNADEKDKALDALLRLDEDVEPSPELDQRVFAAIAAEKKQRSWLRALLRPLVLGPLAGAAVAALVAVVFLPRGPSAEELFIAENAEMLRELDMMRELDAAEDFHVIANLPALERGD